MKRKFFVLVSLVMVASMILSACSPAKAPTTPPASDVPAALPTKETAAEMPAGEAPTAEPTKAAEPTAVPMSDRKGGWLDKIVFSAIADPEPAVAQIQANSVDMYAVSVDDATVFDKVKSDANLKYSMIYGSSNQMLFNTETCSDTNILNPFTDAKIREAMNWAFDRNYVAQEIMGGLALPKYVALTSAFPDYSRYYDLVAAIETKYAYNLDKAKTVVNEEMLKLGATLGSDGKWQYNGKPVVVIGLIRTEDRRKEIGNYLASQMEALGFTVDRQEKTRAEASPIYTGEPKDCKFTFYTAGWGAQAINVDEGNMFVQYNTGKMQTSIPLFAHYQPSPELLNVSDRLFTNNYKTMDERRELFAKALDLSMQESWWGLWATDNIAFTPYKQGISGASDLAAGFANASLYPYTVRFDGKEGGEMKIAQSGILVEPWNPIAGSNWSDDGMVQKAAEDWGVIPDPYTGLNLPKMVEKADLTVEEGLPVKKTMDWVNLSFEKEIKVPGDAWVDWDATTQKFITAAEKWPEGMTTKTKTVVYYRPQLWETTWHDGNKMTPADFVMNMIMNFDPGKKDSKIYDEITGSAVETYLTHFKGVRIVSTDPLTIETYEDQFFPDAENTVTSWYPSQYLPTTSTTGMIAWHDITPAIMAEANNEMAFSSDKASALKVDQTSFISGPTLDIQVKYLDQAITDKYIPYAPTMSQYIKPEEALARYENLKKWYETKKHLFIGTGPYYIDQVFPVERTITVSRYDKYQFLADEWSRFGEPKMVTISVDGPISVQSGEEASFDVTVDFKDQPYPAADIDKVTYILFNGKNDVVATGTAENAGEGMYQIVLSSDVTGKLDAGGAKMSVAASSKLVSIPAFATAEFVVTK